jgi:carbamate kinase
LPELAEGSMRPKVEAAVTVARAGGEAIITALDRVEDALAGTAGTRVAH